MCPPQRHQHFQGITKSSKINKLLQEDDAKSDISCHGKSIGYRSRCHWWHLISVRFPVVEHCLWADHGRRDCRLSLYCNRDIRPL